MSTITTINSSDLITNSRAVINTNFANLNSDKAEKSNNLSDMTVPNTALNNILPTQAALGGKVLGTDGSNVSWVDPSGASKATQSVQGITALSVAAVDPLLPKALGENDGRVPTQSENDALVGTGTPSSSNKYVTADTDALKEVLSNKATSTSLGTSDTLYPSQNAVKIYVDGKLSHANGTTTKNSADASAVQNIAHGLGRTPYKVSIKATLSSGGVIGAAWWAETVYNGTTQSSQSIRATNAAPDISAQTFTLNGSTSSTGTTDGVVTFDGTNIIITWTKTNSPSGTYQILWEAE